MENKINFSYNWNNKLYCKFFTTFRAWFDGKPGDVYTLTLKNEPINQVQVVEVRAVLLKDVNQFVAGLDAGYTVSEFVNMVKTMYKNKNIDFETHKFKLILFKTYEQK